MAFFPGALWPGNVRGAFMDDPDIHEKWHDDIQAEVKAMQAEMGVNPSGWAATLQARWGAATLSISVFSADGTWNKPSGASLVWVRGVGGGGGGGGVGATAAGQGAIGGGGGGGGYREWFASAGTFAASEAVVIGAGGNGGVAGANNGSPGGDTTFDLLTCGGGLGGDGSISAASGVVASAATGGGGSGGHYGVSGGRGTHGQVVTGGIPIVSGSKGGDSIWGRGGLSPATTGSSAGTAGGNWGGGGSGAVNGPGQTSKAGGAGAQGLLVVVTFIK